MRVPGHHQVQRAPAHEFDVMLRLVAQEHLDAIQLFKLIHHVGLAHDGRRIPSADPAFPEAHIAVDQHLRARPLQIAHQQAELLLPRFVIAQ